MVMNENILVIKLRMIGDAVISTPSIRALKEHYEGSHVVLLTSPPASEVFKNNPYVDEIMIYDRIKMNSVKENIVFFKELRRKKIDIAVNLHATFRTALIAFFCRAKKRVVHNHSGRNYFSSVKITAKKESKSAIERDLDAVRALGVVPKFKKVEIFLDKSEEEFGLKYIKENAGYNPEKNKEKLIAIHPGARRADKLWDSKKYAIVAELLIRKYNAKLLVISGPGEESIGNEVISEIKSRNSVAHVKDLNIRQVAGIIKHCDLFTGNDSGLFHIAVALDVPTVTLFGPENPVEWHPYNGRHFAIYKNNIKDIRAEDVTNKIEELFSLRIC